MKTYYKITLTPTERFFFGSDKTFGMNNVDTYFVQSRLYPQQTTLLGMLRYLLLFQNNLMDEKGKVLNIVAANKLIGVSSFNPSHQQNYGKIEHLSPVFLEGPDGIYTTLSREYTLQNWKDERTQKTEFGVYPLKLKWLENNNMLPIFEGITSKSQFPEMIVNIHNGNILPLEVIEKKNNIGKPVFISNTQVGITKFGKNDSGDAGFYKQVGYRLRKGFSYLFYAALDKDDTYIFNDGDIPMGSDQSWFTIRIKEVKEEEANLAKLKPVYNNINPINRKLVLLSDTWLNINDYKDCVKNAFLSCETLTFKYIETTAHHSKEFKTNEYYKASGSLKLDKTKTTCILLKRGGVFFFKTQSDKEDFQKKLENQEYKAFQNIGYNYTI